ncbi:hypothetical protein, partial [Cohnella sp. AR92]
MAKANKNLTDFKSNISRSLKGVGAALATLSIGAGLSSVIKNAMQVEAAFGQLERTMGESAKEFNRWASNTASAFGLSRSAAIQYGATYARVISDFSSGSKETLKLTQDTLKAASMISASTGM